MRRLESILDDMDHAVTYELSDGRRVRLDKRVVSEMGLAAVMRHMGLDDQIPKGRIPVVHHGRPIGTVPADFDPLFIKSSTFLYDPRPGDFHRSGDVWVAANNLGPGDLQAIAGFQGDSMGYRPDD